MQRNYLFVIKYINSLSPNIVLILLFITGATIYDDYGVHWDEYNNQYFGEMWYRYSLESIKAYKPLVVEINSHDIIHGSFIEIVLLISQKLLSIKDPREVLLIRHLFVFIIFCIGVIAFHFLTKRIFIERHFILLGSLLLILHPRILAHSFYNTVDIPFMVLYIVSTYSLINFIKGKTYLSAILHAICCAILIDIRIAGLIVPLITVVFYSLDYIVSERGKKMFYLFSIYSITLVICIILLWPYLWIDPINNIIRAFNESKYNAGIASPWYYNFLWISLTTPFLYLVLFTFGFAKIACRIVSNPIGFYIDNKEISIVLSLLIIPLIIPIVFKTMLFDEWRHHYFIYPMIIILCLYATKEIITVINSTYNSRRKLIFKFIITIIFITSIMSTFIYIYKNHPFQNTYSNFISGEDKNLVKVDKSVDYWGLSYRQILEYIINNDNKRKIKVAYSNIPAKNNFYILTKADQNRIEFVDKEDAEYYITNFRYHGLEDIPHTFQEYHSIKVDGIKISSVYRRKDIKSLEKK